MCIGAPVPATDSRHQCMDASSVKVDEDLFNGLVVGFGGVDGVL